MTTIRLARRHGLFLVVGDMDEAAAGAALQGQELVLHLAAEIEVEGAQGLVQQEDLRLHDEGAGQSHALALAARELMHAARPEAGEPYHIQGPLDPLMALLRRHAPELQPEADVALHRHMGKQSVVLEHRRRRAYRGSQPRHIAPRNPDAARRGKGETADHREQRGLAAARGAQEHDVILAAHGERDIVQRHHLAIELAHPLDRQMRGGAHRRFLNSSSSTTIMSRMEQRKMKEPAALVSAFTPPLSRLRITTGKVTSKRVFSSAIRVSSQEKVKQRQKAAMRAGAIIGAVMLTSTRRVEAPRSRAAASMPPLMLAELGEADGKGERHVDHHMAGGDDPEAGAEAQRRGAHQQPHADEEIGDGKRQDDDGLHQVFAAKLVARDAVSGEEADQHREGRGDPAHDQGIDETVHQPAIGEGGLIPAQDGPLKGGTGSLPDWKENSTSTTTGRKMKT